MPKPEKVPQGLAAQQQRVEWYLIAGDWDKKREEILFSVRSRVLHDPPMNLRRKHASVRQENIAFWDGAF